MIIAMPTAARVQQRYDHRVHGELLNPRAFLGFHDAAIDDDSRPTRRSRRRAFRGRRIGARQATTADPQSSWKRSPNLRLADRLVVGVCALLIRSGRLIRSAIVLKPSTLLSLHRALTLRKYRRLFSPQVRKKPGRQGPTQEVMAAVVDMKQRNPTWGCPRVAQQIALAFGIPINKDVVRRILAARYQPKPDPAGPSWLTVLGHAKDSLWSLDLFQCESAILRTHWVLVAMDQFTAHRGLWRAPRRRG